MFYKKVGLPEEGDVVLCTITKIQYSSVFADIDDYGISGMIHISEIAAGRIRNIRDYVKEGKKVACKVLRIYADKGHVDLSLRRVNENQKRNKVNEIKFEQKAESIIEHVAKENKIDPQKLYDDVSKIIFKDYLFLHHAFEDVINDKLDLVSILPDKKIAAELNDLVNQRFKPKFIEINGSLTLTTYESNGIDMIKSALIEAEKLPGVIIKYLGGGKYKLTVKAIDYKEAEPILEQAVELSTKDIKQKKGIAEFKRV
jgi:translation initiation factor 2 subunit 1